jgi:hypothetical protein
MLTENGLSKTNQKELAQDLALALDFYNLDRALSVLIEWGIIEADLASEIIEKEGA